MHLSSPNPFSKVYFGSTKKYKLKRSRKFPEYFTKRHCPQTLTVFPEINKTSLTEEDVVRPCLGDLADLRKKGFVLTAEKDLMDSNRLKIAQLRGALFKTQSWNVKEKVNKDPIHYSTPVADYENNPSVVTETGKVMTVGGDYPLNHVFSQLYKKRFQGFSISDLDIAPPSRDEQDKKVQIVSNVTEKPIISDIAKELTQLREKFYSKPLKQVSVKDFLAAESTLSWLQSSQFTFKSYRERKPVFSGSQKYKYNVWFGHFQKEKIIRNCLHNSMDGRIKSFRARAEELEKYAPADKQLIKEIREKLASDRKEVAFRGRQVPETTYRPPANLHANQIKIPDRPPMFPQKSEAKKKSVGDKGSNKPRVSIKDTDTVPSQKSDVFSLKLKRDHSNSVVKSQEWSRKNAMKSKNSKMSKTSRNSKNSNLELGHSRVKGVSSYHEIFLKSVESVNVLFDKDILGIDTSDESD